MTTTLITPPAVQAVGLIAAKEALKVDGADMDTLIAAWVSGITAHAEHVTGRSFIAQTWRATLPGFSASMRLPSSPVISISSVKYIDQAGAEQTLDPAAYVVTGECMLPAYGATWPATREQADAVKIEGVFGYGATADDVPAGIKLYLIAALAQQFDPAVRLEKDTVQASFIDRLLDRYRTYF